MEPQVDMRMWMRLQGFTLLEWLMTLAVTALLITLAAPAFNSLRQDAERTTHVNALFHALFLARSEAIKRGQTVTVCPSVDGNRCAGAKTPWNAGWLVFVNTDHDQPPERDAGEPVLLVHSGWRGGTIHSNRPAFSFGPYRHGVVNGTIVFCDRRGSAHARAIIVSHTGRPRVSQRDARQRPLKCTQ